MSLESRPTPTTAADQTAATPDAGGGGETRIHAFGVDYSHVHIPAYGDLYLTRYGAPFVEHLHPAQWFADRHYERAGQRLPGATGTVYRVPTRPVEGRSIDVVVKFSRVAQDVPLVVATTFVDGDPSNDMINARFNSPFEEFGLMMDMRRGTFGPSELRILAHRPLAIFVPHEKIELWRLGRSRSAFQRHQAMLRQDQEDGEQHRAIELDIKRDYLLIYSWIKGEDAEAYFDQHHLGEDELHQLTPRVNRELAAKGFRVLDNKPKHFILRRGKRSGQLLRRRDRFVYALVDFELLERSRDYHQEFQSSRRRTYLEHQSHRVPSRPSADRPDLTPVRIMNVDYLYGATPNGGRIWVVGNDPELFDYFVPDRWRRTPRLKLSSINELYRTRTRDNIHVVYRQSRVGEQPHVDPAYEPGKSIMAYGFNSPFEEVRIAQALRDRGVRTVYPRAIYRTAHESVRAHYLIDPRRYESHASLRNPDDPAQSILISGHDHYTIWGQWRGIDVVAEYRHAHGDTATDMPQAYEDGLLSAEDYGRLTDTTHARMMALGFTDAAVQHLQFLLVRAPGGDGFCRDASGDLQVIFCVDALRAFEYGLLSEKNYRQLIERHRGRLWKVGFESLNLQGAHLLLTVDTHGELLREEDGEPLAVQCNFKLIQQIGDDPDASAASD